MKNTMKTIFSLLFVLALLFTISLPVFAANDTADTGVTVTASEESEAPADDAKSGKALAAAIAVGLAAAAGAIAMGIAIGKSVESIARQPEAEGNIRTSLMLGLVFIETAIIYALIVGILIIFVL